MASPDPDTCAWGGLEFGVSHRLTKRAAGAGGLGQGTGLLWPGPSWTLQGLGGRVRPPQGVSQWPSAVLTCQHQGFQHFLKHGCL